MCRMLPRKVTVLLAVVFAIPSSAFASAAEPVDAAIRPVLRAIGRRELAELHRAVAARKQIEDAKVTLGPWMRIGPFRNSPPLLNWMENAASSFAFRYEVETDLAADVAPRTAKTYPAPNFPATPDAVRKWQVHPEWIDGYLCDLPRGPAPSAGETQYVHRTITVDKPVTIGLEFAVRSPESDRRMDATNMQHWLRQTRYVCTLNGEELFRFEGKGRAPGSGQLGLKAGVNHFVAKITNNRHAYGFSFAIVGLHPAPRRKGGHEQPWRPFQSYRPNDTPFFRDGTAPDWYVSGATWREALYASVAKLRGRQPTQPQPDIVIADFEGGGYRGWRAVGDAFGPAPAKGTLGRQQKVSGFAGRGLVNTYRNGDGSTGTLTSPTFDIERDAIRFLIGGGRHPGQCCLNLLIGGKVVRTATGDNNETLSWRYWSVAEFRGRKATLEIVDRQKGGWGHVNVDQIVQGTPKGPDEASRGGIWLALRRQFTDANSRFEIELTAAAENVFWNCYDKTGDRAKTENALADHHLRNLAKSAGVPPVRVLDALGALPGRPDYAETVAAACLAAHRYREALIRLRAFRSVYSPMPGIEAAARDSRGRVVTRMEADLETCRESVTGRRHRLAVEALGGEIESLLKSLVADAADPRAQAVLALDEKIEQMWAERIRGLPEIAFLARPSYHYDALQFTRDGSGPAAVRVFDPAVAKVRTLYGSPSLRAHDMTLSWDAKTVLIGGGGNVAEVGVDGSGYRVITRGQSPTEMPDGRLVFHDDAPGISACKSRGPRRLLFTINRDGTHRKVVSGNLTIDTTPQIADDGRVLFCRWDYGVNKNVFNRHAIWVQNPDGTALDLFFGNTIIDPFAFYRPRQVPGRPEVVCVFGTHHRHNAGLVGLLWQGRGREGGDGVGFRRITHDTASVGDAAPHWAYQDPYPLNEQLFLVSYGGVKDRPVAMYLLDRFGNKKCIFEPTGGVGAFCPQPFVPRKRPPVIATRTSNGDWAPADLREQLLTDPNWSKKGTMLLQDVYRGISPEISRGRVKHLAVMEQVVHTSPRGGAIGVGAIFYVNRLIGRVPVEADGSARFEVPALRSLYFHALDKDGKMLMTMGSDFHAMPGERRGCVGCHEQRKGVGVTSVVVRPPLAARRPATRPKLPGWGTNGIIEYEAVVQPVLDKYCVKCHSGAKPKANLDLTGSRTTVYNMSYMQLVDRALVHFVPGTGATHAQPSNGYDEQAPLSRGTLLSKITAKIENPKHSGVEIPWDERFGVYCWIDSNVPFYSHYRQMSPTILSEPARKELLAVYNRRCGSCHDRRPRKDAISWLSKYNSWVHAGPRPGQWGVTESGLRVRHLNLSTPANSMALQAPLGAKAGGLQMCVPTPGGAPVFADKSDPDYKRMLKALATGVIKRDQPGVWEMLRKRQASVATTIGKARE